MNLGEIRTYIKTNYRDGAVSVTDTRIDEQINTTYKDLSRIYTRDSIQESSTGLATVASQEFYVLDRDSRRIFEVHMNSTASVRGRLKSMDAMARAYPRPTGQPAKWYSFGVTASTSGDNRQQFGLDPVPSTDHGGLALFVLYEPEPADLAVDADVPQYVPEEKHHLIAWGAMAKVAGLQEDFNNSQYWEAHYRSGYNEILQEMGMFGKQNFPETSKQTGR